MTNNLKIEIQIKRDRKTGTYDYSVPALGIDKQCFMTEGAALDEALKQINSFFQGIVQNPDGKRLGMDSFTSSVKLSLNFRVMTEKPLDLFTEPQPAQALESVSGSGSRKAKVKAA